MKNKGKKSTAFAAGSVSDSLNTVQMYHHRTKHHYHRYARSLGMLDWDNQPDPFRRFPEAQLVSLPVLDDNGGPFFDGLALQGSSAKVDQQSISQFLFDSMALSGWKQVGDSKWSLRCNPSSGNLHPTESYVILPQVQGLTDGPGLYHYNPYEHGLERRTEIGSISWPKEVRAPLFFVGLSSIHWREAWKYGERAYRYCQHDVGHAIACLAYSAGALGWCAQLVETLADRDLAKVLGIGEQWGEEAEQPDILMAVTFPGQLPAADWRPTSSFVSEIAEGTLPHAPAPLSKEHHPWPVIHRVHQACERLGPPGPNYFTGEVFEHDEDSSASPRNIGARQVFRQRRSAVSMDGVSSQSKADFFILVKALMDSGPKICRTLPWQPAINLLFYVHRVDGLKPGLYLLDRQRASSEVLKEFVNKEFLWQETHPKWPLYLLEEGDFRGHAKSVSCGQDIAADGAFAVSMLADFAQSLKLHGPSMYRRLHWEAGLLGQIMYLEAEAAGLRGTGIGCFFDDAIHSLLGVKGDGWQSIYNFTVGGPVEDTRIKSLPAYEHLSE